MKKVFTTGQVAKICKVAPRTVSKWFDSGRLRGYRIPGSQDRRIPREHLLRFLKEHGMPLGDLEAEVYHKILVVGADAPLLGSLREQLREGDDFRIETAASGFEAGIRAESFHPDCIVIDLAVGRQARSIDEFEGPPGGPTAVQVDLGLVLGFNAMCDDDANRHTRGPRRWRSRPRSRSTARARPARGRESPRRRMC